MMVELPNVSNLMWVTHLRYIQTIHEQGERHNPDILVRHFIPLLERIRYRLLSRAKLRVLREDPFYYYLLARTKYYDTVVEEAIASGAGYIIGVGSGSDTRAHRFDELLCSRDVSVLECDLPESIHAKQAMARRLRGNGHVEYLPIDLNDGVWPELERWIKEHSAKKTLVMMEGVSPYINGREFGKFLDLLSAHLLAGSEVAYDFKIPGINDRLGHLGRTHTPFRLLASSREVEAFHQKHHLVLEHLELSYELSARLLPELGPPAGAFLEDGLVRLRVSQQ
jgi:methyltransferase (TIGR00027 family)